MKMKKISQILLGLSMVVILHSNVYGSEMMNEQLIEEESSETSDNILIQDEISEITNEQTVSDENDPTVNNELQSDENFLQEDETNISKSNIPGMKYRAHVCNIGWMEWVESGVIGTTGKNLPMEAMEIVIGDDSDLLGIEYQTHVRNIGWMDAVADGETAGTTGRALAIEAVKMNLTGELSDAYDLYYRAHVTNMGWLDWASEGEAAGTQGYAYTLQAIEIVLLPAGSEAPKSNTGKEAFYHQFHIYHEAYVQSRGWMPKNNVSVMAGTTGKNLNLDALKLSTNGAYDIGIAYSVHVRNIGWMGYASDGEIAGIIKEGHTIEAIKIHLTGTNADRFDLYYRSHVANIGWLDWASNDEIAGSSGLGYALQALELRVVDKGDDAPGITDCSYVKSPAVVYTACVSDVGWQESVSNGAVSGTTGKNLPLRALSAEIPDMEDLGIKYSAHISNIGWTEAVYDGAAVGSETSTNDIEAIRMELTGSHAKHYDIWYRVHSANLGWLGWAKNGEAAGTSSLCYDAQAVQVVVRVKGSSAPGSTERAYVDTLEEDYLWPLPGNYYITSYFGYRNQPTAGASTYHQGIDIDGETGDIIVATKSGIVTAATYNSTRGYYVEITHDNGVKTIYMHMSRYIVSPGMRISRGQTIGYVGSTGVSTGSHLHFSLLINGRNVNPLDHVKR